MNAKNLSKWLVLGGLLALAGFAYADFNVQDKGSYYNNASTGLRTTSLGHLTTAESDPAMDANLTFSNIIVNSALAVAAADSSVVLDTHRMRLGMLYFKATMAAGAGDFATNRFAIQIRAHLNGSDDSLSTFAIYPGGSSGMLTATAIPDTLNVGHLLQGSTSAPWSGEFVLTDDIDRHGSGGTTALFPYPAGIAVPLSNIFGREVYAPYISVRVRNLSGRTASIALHLAGTPL